MSAETVLHILTDLSGCKLLISGWSQFHSIEIGAVGTWLIGADAPVNFKIFMVYQMKVKEGLISDLSETSDTLDGLACYYLAAGKELSKYLGMWQGEIVRFAWEYLSATLMADSVSSGAMTNEQMQNAVAEFRVNVQEGNFISSVGNGFKSGYYCCKPPSTIIMPTEINFQDRFVGDCGWIGAADVYDMYDAHRW